ncbi:MAG: hypothetical protein DPW16_01615 [Chloroflexi bacterium]|nr:hypothetical protein [Chloroflexota bacterium]
MRITRFLSIGAVITLLMLTLVACLGDDDPTPGPRRTLNVLDNAVQLGETQQAATRNAVANATQSFEQTLSAYQTSIAPPTQAPIRLRSPQPPPTATDAPENDILGNIVYPGNWLDVRFTTIDGQEESLRSFEGKIIVLLPMSLDCIPCQEQLAFARETDRQFRLDGVAYEVVYLNLNVSPLDELDDLTAWAEGQGFESTEQFTWITGKASPELVTALNAAFGGSVLNLQRTPILIVDTKGQGHTAAEEGMLISSRLRDVIVFYSDQATPAEASGGETEATEEVTSQ